MSELGPNYHGSKSAKARRSNCDADLELKASVRELCLAAPEDKGAQLALAINLLRLDRKAEANRILTELVKLPPPLGPLALAIRAEQLLLEGEDKQATAIHLKALQLAPEDLRIRVVRAEALAAAGHFDDSEREWRLVLRDGKHELIARRALAQIAACRVRITSAAAATALEIARLADALAGESSWSCKLTLALCYAINGDPESAANTATVASELALLEKRDWCLEVAEKLKQGERCVWRFGGVDSQPALAHK